MSDVPNAANLSLIGLIACDKGMSDSVLMYAMPMVDGYAFASRGDVDQAALKELDARLEDLKLETAFVVFATHPEQGHG